MTFMSWYRTYRPQRVADLEIQPVREHFLEVLASGQYSHAYLFTGPRGTGKTSTARILARVLNDPQNAEKVLQMKGPLAEPNPDDRLLQRIAQGRAQVVIEQDAASHRGIDDIRQLQEEVSVVPTEGTVRVVILDEVHMLTAEAFNALLKLLEEPPAQVVFILATTELHKVPATIQSRCQVIRFRLASKPELENVLKKVMKSEGVEADANALEGLISAANGSFRDAVKWLEQLAVKGRVDAAAVSSLLGSTQIIPDLLRALAQKDIAELQRIFSELRQAGASFGSLETAVLQALHERLTRALARQETPATVQNILLLLEFLVQRLPGGPEPIDGLRFEVACYRWALGASIVDPVEPQIVSKASAASKASPAGETKAAQVLACLVTPVAEKREPVAGETLSLTVNRVQAVWEAILLTVRTRSTAVEALLRTATIGQVTDTSLEIVLARPFHQERLNTPKYQLLVHSAMEEHLGPGFQISFVVRSQDPNEFLPVDSTPDDFAKVVENLVAGL